MSKRVIKFRAWDGERMHYPSDGEYMAIFSGPGQVAWRLYSRHSTTVCDSQYGGVLMQFTGLKDKNGKEIYEGDIVRVDSERYNDLSARVLFTGKVIMSQGGWRLIYGNRFLNLSDHYSHSTSLEEHDCRFDDGEVIGNIHENPELLR